ncbi:hypothetical protein JL720_11624 [Aureococcus anophagefferens]|nr:hypothetical protein JL720_11624 [Aureococcus anophagefferens]
MAAIDQLEGFPSGQESCVLLVALGSLGDALPLVALADALCGLLARVRVVVSAETYEQLARILGDDASLARVSALSPATGVFGGSRTAAAAARRRRGLELVHEAALPSAAPVLCAPTVEPAGDERSAGRGARGALVRALAAHEARLARRRGPRASGRRRRRRRGPRDAAARASRGAGAAVYGGGAPAPSKRRAAGWEWAAARGEESALVFSGYWRPRDLRFDHARVPAALLRGEPKSGGGERRALVCFGSVPLASLGVDEARFFRVVRRAVAGFRAFFHGGPRPDDGDWPAGAVPSPRSASAFTSRASRTASRAPSTGSRRPSPAAAAAAARAAGGAAAPSAALGLPLDPALAAACAMLFDGATATTLCSYAAERARRRAVWLDRKAAAGLYLSRRMPPGTSVEVAAFCAFLFVPRPAYGGRRPGAVFRAGDRGVGYYPDPY